MINEKNKCPHQIKLENNIKMLTAINKFVFLRANEAGKLIWLDSKNATGNANNCLRNLLDLDFVIRWKLPENKGYCYVLNRSGAKFLNAHLTEIEMPARSRANWGKTKTINGITKWHPPAKWKHDLLATAILAEYACTLRDPGWIGYRYKVYSENEFRFEYRKLIYQKGITKIPDGVIVDLALNVAHFLEVELSQKGGFKMSSLVENVIQPNFDNVFDYNLSNTVVGFDVYQTNNTMHHIHHEDRIVSAVSRKLAEIDKNSANLIFFKATLKGGSIASKLISPKLVHRDDAKQIQQARKNKYNELHKIVRSTFEKYDDQTWYIQLFDFRAKISKLKSYYEVKLYQKDDKCQDFTGRETARFQSIKHKPLVFDHYEKAMSLAIIKVTKLCVDFKIRNGDLMVT